MEKKFNDNIQSHSIELAKLQRKSMLLGNLRLVLAMGLVVFVVLSILNWFSVLYFFLMGACLCGFVFLTVLHSEVSAGIAYHKGQIAINNEYLARISGEWKGFADNGKEYVDYNHDYSYDLDIFGDKSLFQFINTTKTPFGRERLRRDLSAPRYSGEKIAERQQAIEELKQKDRLAMDFQYYGGQIKQNKDLPKIISYLKQKPLFINKHWAKYILYPLPIAILLLSVVFLCMQSPVLRILASLLMGIQIIIWGLFSPKTQGYLAASEKIHYSLSDYSQIYSLLENQQFCAKNLVNIQGDLTSASISAAKATKKLARVLQRIQMRSSGILYLILNILFLWDIGCALSLSDWTKKYATHVEQWFVSLGEFESLLSFSVLGEVLDNASLATLSDSMHTLVAQNIGHPLLGNSERVCNSFTLKNNINIISGSNMSGKTTFLRTLGINLLLAKNGSFVCANQMCFSNMEIASSMRVSDDLTDGISTFYSELKKIKRILEIVSKNPNTLILIDEIFRGTNSSDRMAGARAVIKKLKEYGAYGLLTTHDLALCEDSQRLGIANYNFSERYVDGELVFDYRINDGIAKTTNGEYLMKLLGII